MNAYRLIVVAALAALLSIPAPANEVKPEDKEAWHGSVALGLSVATGNSDSTLFTLGVNGDRVRKVDEWHLSLNGSYGRTDGDKGTEVLRGATAYRRTMDERWYWTIAADGLHDGVANIEYRVFVGPGAGYYFIKTDATRLSAEAGPSYVWEKTDVVHPGLAAPNPDRVSSEENDYLAVRVAERFDRKLNDKAKVWQQTEWLPQVDDFENYLLITEVGAEAALNSHLSLRLVGTHRYDNVTPDKRRHYDITLVTSVAYKF
jgi:putative salt-induced outer membrane protein